MAKTKKQGRPAETHSERIDDTPERAAEIILSAPPKPPDQWRYTKDARKGERGDPT